MTIVTGETLPELNVPVPGYDRRQVTTGIVHIGVGGFHRSHMAMYLDTLMNRGAVFGDLADDPRFTRVYRAILTALLDSGVRKTLADLDQYA
jgi:hypothetical protein